MNICITGVSRGLGRELVKVLSQKHSVWGISRDEEALHTLATEIGERFSWSQVDIRNRDDIARWSSAMQEAKFTPDIIVLNASVQYEDMIEAYDHQLGHDTITTNLEGPLQCIEEFLPLFLQTHGQFIAIVSTSAHRPSIRSASYAASKAGLSMAMRTFRMRHGKQVRFASVMMGPIATGMWKGSKKWFIPEPHIAARAIARFIRSKRSRLYYPFFSTLFLRLTIMLPDRFFSFVSERAGR